MQQRLLGAILLVALGVIFIPVLLDGSGFKSRNSRSITMPPEPEFPPLSEIELAPVEPKHVTQKSTTVAKTRPQPVQPKKRTTLKQPTNAFALQVSTVTIKDNAYALRDKLRKDGYTAYVETRTRNGKTSYRVRIGPELDKRKLEKLKVTLQKKEGLDGFIVNHP
ncbi:MAG: SPOR domain-containing protein [Thiotrichales bacterium]|nr:MAG: SPOR domain-containing protein [Thiotrichales bacterium]